MNQFYVVLPSDSSMDFFPENTVAHFKTKLAKRICTDGDYEVAITELIYPMKAHKFMLKDPLVVRTKQRDRAGYFTWELKSGDFKDASALAEILNGELIEKLEKAHGIRTVVRPVFRYDAEKGYWNFQFKSTMAMDDGSVKQVSWRPERVGLQRDFIYFLTESFKPTELYLMYIYSDIVSPHLVGDVQTPLLRVVAVKGERDEMVTVTFDKPYYLPVSRQDFDQIEINLNTELGTPMPFTGGKSTVVLHFRPRNESLLSNAAFR